MDMVGVEGRGGCGRGVALGSGKWRIYNPGAAMQPRPSWCSANGILLSGEIGRKETSSILAFSQIVLRSAPADAAGKIHETWNPHVRGEGFYM